VVAVATFNPDPGGSNVASELYCFSRTGRPLWRYKPEITVRSPGQEFGGPWHATAILVSPEGRPKHIWLALAHHTSWPSLVVKLDHYGKAGLLSQVDGMGRPEEILNRILAKLGQGGVAKAAG
jgi:hypothetical protein